MKSTDELIRIVAFGGGLDFDASSFTTDDLVRIASYASGKGCRLILRGIGGRTTDELVRIASFGKGVVTFKIDS